MRPEASKVSLWIRLGGMVIVGFGLLIRAPLVLNLYIETESYCVTGRYNLINVILKKRFGCGAGELKVGH